MTLETVHLVLVTLAFATFWVSFVLGSLFLFQEVRLKNHQPLPAWLRPLPPLEIMDSLHYKFLTAGFLFLSFGMVAGALLSKRVFGVYFNFDPRQTASLFTWGIYALFLNVRIRSGWRGRRGILLSLLGFLTVALTFLAIHHRGV